MQISEKDKQRIQKFYGDLLNQHGPESPYSLSWRDANSQILRFSVLSQIAPMENSSILDVGCGLGDLYAHLRQTVSNFKYVGIDIVPEMIAKARDRFAGADFRVFDFSQKMDGNYDFVFSSGALSLKIKNSREVYFAMIKRMFDIAKKGVAFNVLDKNKHVDDEVFAAYSPSEIYEYCSCLTDKLVLRHDYLDYDFTVYLYH